MSKKTISNIYDWIMEACYKEGSFLYGRYGEKGIKVCEEWHDKAVFVDWCKEKGWHTGLTVKRVNTEGDFCPENCYIDEASYKKVDEITKRELGYTVLGTKLTKHPLARTYSSMKDRCYNENNSEYKNYGGRGIKISNEWLGKYGIIKFLIWSLENGWAEGLSIERIDVNRGYSPDNCRWIPMEEQPRNMRGVKLYEYDGKLLTIGEVSKLTGLSITGIRNRIVKGMDMVSAVNDLKAELLKKQRESEERRIMKEKERIRKEELKNDVYFSTGAINFSAVERKYGISGRKVKILVENGVELSEAIARLRPGA